MPGSMPEESQVVGIPKPGAWNLHFPDTEYHSQDRRALLIRRLEAHYAGQGWSALQQLSVQHGACALPVDFAALRSSCADSDLAVAMEVQPLEALGCVSAALYEVLFVSQRQRAGSLLAAGQSPSKVAVHLMNYPETVTRIRLLKSTTIGKLVTLRGTVIRSSPVRPLVTHMSFVCGKCGGTVQCAFPDGMYAQPTACLEGCRSRTFAPIRSSAVSVDWRKVRLQEMAEAAGQEEGRVPRTIEVELSGPLVDSCAAGDAVTVLGFVKVIAANPAAAASKSSDKQSMFLMYVDALSVVAHRRGGRAAAPSAALQSNAVMCEAGIAAEAVPGLPPPSLRDLEFIVAFSQQMAGVQFKQLAHAVSPSIYGHELLKAGILLALLGGVRKGGNDPGTTSVPLRGDIHVLLVGDPGLGKSQLLQAAAAAAPRGVYICGNTSSCAGLTAAVVRDGVTGDYALEAGALVLADRGICCVDELDKMTADHQVLLSAMEQGEVAVAKAGIVASLPARTALLAAANPQGGHYNRAKTLQENLKMSGPLLSRFDLIFVLLDSSDENRDRHLSEHVMALHSGQEGRAAAARQRLIECRPHPAAVPLISDGRENRPASKRLLVERLRLQAGDCADPLPTQLLQKYIAYARTYVSPVLSDEAAEVLRNFYLQLRRQASLIDGAPVTARQLESLVRLAEARARVDLSNVVTAEHAQDAVELMEGTMCDTVLADMGGRHDPRSRSRGGLQGEAKRYLAALKKTALQQGNAMLSVATMYSIADGIDLQTELQPVIELLNDACEILKKAQQYEVVEARNELRRMAGSTTGSQWGH